MKNKNDILSDKANTNKIKNYSFPSQEDLKEMRNKEEIVNLVLPENVPLS